MEAARITGDVVQARDVLGGLHFHSASEASRDARVIPHQLPADVGAFVDRSTERRALTRLVPAGGSRGTAAMVVVITGSAGVGKTALAVHWGHSVRERFPDGELYASLRGYDDSPPVTADAVLDRFLRDLDVSPQAVPDDTDGRTTLFRSLIDGRRILIVLDNASDVGQVRPLIPGGPGPLVIITSRSRLPGLAIRDGARRIQLDILQESQAIALLRRVTRTGGRRDDTPDDLAILAQLCARLPLALRVAAERAISRPTMRLAELIADLRDDSMLWDALSVGEGPHGEAVRTVFTWSYRDLQPDAARMFRALGLHPGPDISLEAAAAAVGLPARAARRTLDILLGAFLVESVRPHRYQLHDLLRAYALDQARTIDTEDQRLDTLDRMLRWYITAASRACPALANRSVAVDVPPPDGPEPPAFENATAAFEWFDTERPNLVAAARAALDAGLDRRAWELAMALSPIHATYHTFDDWSALSGAAVTAAERIADAPMLADALANRGGYFFRRRVLDEATAMHTRALAIREETGDRPGILLSLNALGLIALRTRQLAEAAARFAEVAERARRDGDRFWDGIGRMNQAEAQLEAGDAAAALPTISPLPEFFADLGDAGYEGNSLWLLSWAHRLSGNLPDALAAIDAALRIAEDASNRMREAWWLIEAARVYLALGDAEEAMRCCRMSASLERQIGDHSREATALDLTGEVQLAIGRADDAAAFHREAARMHRQLGDQWQEALATVHLAECEQILGHDDASRDLLTTALALLQQFPDERATELRADVQARLA